MLPLGGVACFFICICQQEASRLDQIFFIYWTQWWIRPTLCLLTAVSLNGWMTKHATFSLFFSCIIQVLKLHRCFHSVYKRLCCFVIRAGWNDLMACDHSNARPRLMENGSNGLLSVCNYPGSIFSLYEILVNNITSAGPYSSSSLIGRKWLLRWVQQKSGRCCWVRIPECTLFSKLC